MAEIVVRTGERFADYASITASLLTEMAEEDLAGGFRASVLWALARLASVARADIEPLLPEVVRSFDDPDPTVRGLAAWCALEAGRRDLVRNARELGADTTPFQIYRDGEFHATSTHDLLAAC